MKPGRPLKRRTPLRSTSTLKRAAIERSGQPLAARGRPLPRESAKRKRERPARAEVRAEVIARDGGCVARRYGLDGECAGPLDVNELVRRGRWRAGYLDPANCVTLCRRHHEWVTVNIAEAKAVGLDLSAPPIGTRPGDPLPG